MKMKIVQDNWNVFFLFVYSDETMCAMSFKILALSQMSSFQLPVNISQQAYVRDISRK